mgnify:FL=1
MYNYAPTAPLYHAKASAHHVNVRRLRLRRSYHSVINWQGAEHYGCELGWKLLKLLLVGAGAASFPVAVVLWWFGVI